jgi:hypothetical protein
VFVLHLLCVSVWEWNVFSITSCDVPILIFALGQVITTLGIRGQCRFLWEYTPDNIKGNRSCGSPNFWLRPQEILRRVPHPCLETLDQSATLTWTMLAISLKGLAGDPRQCQNPISEISSWFCPYRLGHRNSSCPHRRRASTPFTLGGSLANSGHSSWHRPTSSWGSSRWSRIQISAGFAYVTWVRLTSCGSITRPSTYSGFCDI